MYKFSYFTQKANEALNLAIKAAENFGHNYVGSEHILLALVKEEAGTAYTILNEKGITVEDIENFIKENIGVGSPTRLTPDDFTPRSKRVLDVSFKIARGMFRSFVDTEHILLALLQEGDSYAVKYINSCGIDERQLFDGEIRRLIMQERARIQNQKIVLFTNSERILLLWKKRVNSTLLSAGKRKFKG